MFLAHVLYTVFVYIIILSWFDLSELTIWHFPILDSFVPASSPAFSGIGLIPYAMHTEDTVIITNSAIDFDPRRNIES